MFTPKERVVAVLADKGIDRETRERLVPELLAVIDLALRDQRVGISETLTKDSAEYAELEANTEAARMRNYYRGKSSGLMRASIRAAEYQGGAS